jgi:flagella synthesis protein FlgN
MSHSERATHLYNSLAEECEIAMALVDVLLEEQACLIKLETNKLAALALKKEGMMLDLEHRFQNNTANALQAGFAPTMDGLAQWVDSLLKGEPRLQSTYATLRTTLQHAHRLNNVNGELVIEQLAGLQERISILTAAALADKNMAGLNTNTYGPKGSLNGANASTGSTPPRAVIR